MAREQLARKRSGGRTEVAAENGAASPDLLSGPGWEQHETKREGGSYERYSVEEGTTDNLIKFVENGYFTSFLRHWVNKVPYVCYGEGCPLCARGVKAQPVYMFNVIDMTGAKEPELVVWEASANPFKAIKERAEDSKYNPINKPELYFAVSKKKQANGFTDYSLTPAKTRDLKEDYSVEPLDQEEYNRLTENLFDKSIVYVADREKLVEAAEKLED